MLNTRRKYEYLWKNFKTRNKFYVVSPSHGPRDNVFEIKMMFFSLSFLREFNSLQQKMQISVFWFQINKIEAFKRIICDKNRQDAQNFSTYGANKSLANKYNGHFIKMFWMIASSSRIFINMYNVYVLLTYLSDQWFLLLLLFVHKYDKINSLQSLRIVEQHA